MSRPRGFLLAFAAGVVLLLAVAWVGLATEHRRVTEDWHQRLAGVAQDRAALVGVWLAERMADARVNATRPTLRAALAGRRPAEPPRTVLDTLVAAYELEAAVLLGADGRLVAASGRLDGLLEQARPTVAGVLAADTAAMAVLGSRPDAPVLAFIAPMREPGPGGRPAGVTLGAVALLVAPEHQLYPVLAREAGPGTSWRILLLRVTDGVVRVLSSAAPQTGPPPPATMRLDTADAARRELFGHPPGFAGYRDYRGVATLAATARVPGSDWVVLNRIDRSEALADYRRLEAVILAATGLGMLSLGLGLRGLKRKVDATEQQTSQVLAQSQDALRRSEERYRALVEGARDMIFALDPDGKIAWLNPAFERLTGYQRRDWLGRRFVDLLDGADGERAMEAFARVLANDARQPSIQLRLRAADGDIRLGEFTGHAELLGGVPVGVLGVCRDITDRVTLEEQLRQSSKIEAVGQLAGGIAHDFNNILTVIIGSTELLLADMPPDSPWRADVEEIRTSAGRAATLTRQLLAFSRRQMLAPRVLDLNTVVGNAAGMLRRLIGEHIVLDVRLAHDLAAVVADPGQVEQAIVNLAVNARDAMPRGGVLTITTSSVTNTEPLQLGGAPLPPGRWSMIEVKDTGTGLSPDAMRHLFEPFYTTKPLGKGTGLGLASVYGVIKQSKGFVGVQSEPDRGATFRLYLPASGATAGTPAAGAERPSGRQGSETVLLVEDEAAVRAIARETLVRRGYRVLEADGGAAALALAAGGAAPDLLLTDVVMPGMGGPELAERLAAGRPGLKVLFMSGYAGEAAGPHGRLGSGAALLLKPFTPEQLALRVRAVLDGQAE